VEVIGSTDLISAIIVALHYLTYYRPHMTENARMFFKELSSGYIYDLHTEDYAILPGLTLWEMKRIFKI